MSALSINRNEQKSRQEPGLTRRGQDRLTIILFLLPAFLFMFTFLVYPLFQSIYYSFFYWKGFGPPVDWLGIGNYQKILADPIFMKALRNVFLILVLSVTLQLPFSLGLALLLRRQLPGRLMFRTLFFMPYVLSEVITGLIWASMFNPDPQIGLINAIRVLFPGVEPFPFLGDTNTVLICIFIANSWKWFGFHLMLYMAGLANIPRELEEAALIDGANPRQSLWHVTLPLLSPSIRTSVFISSIGSLQIFGLVWVMSQGGPVNASDTIATYMYRFGFVRLQLGYGAAVAMVLMGICLIFSIFYQRLVHQEDYLSSASA